MKIIFILSIMSNHILKGHEDQLYEQFCQNCIMTVNESDNLP